MTNAEMVAAVERHMDAERRRDFDAMVETMTVDCYRKQPGFGFHLRGGRPASRAYYEAWFTSFRGSPEENPRPPAFADEFMVLPLHSTLTMERDFLGIRATGRTARLPMMTLFPFKDGLVHAEETIYDTASFCEQLGISREEMSSALQALAARFEPGS
jgi:hypothetical protein